ncbi:MAG: hypothetical protein K2M94_06190 [Paramuribaculum sp.]|nr:hypothetical protein [Paramuribaculum sp.]
MKKISLSILALSVALFSVAQDNSDNNRVTLTSEDGSSKVMTIADIVKVQEAISSRNSNVAHFEKVWSYNSYFNIAYNSSTLTPKEDIPLGFDYNDGFVPEFKSDWGMSILLGHNYGLHKPIAGILKFNIDWTFIDLNINHYNAEKGDKLYDSGATIDECRYIPWCMEKYDYNYGMALGPSITVAPFTHTRSSQLHFLRFNIYYHIGYHLSLMRIVNEEKYDVNQNIDEKTQSSSVLNFGHGITNSFGFSLSWKSIGIGYEIRSGKLNYSTIQDADYGKHHYKFNDHTSRVYLTIRY